MECRQFEGLGFTGFWWGGGPEAFESEAAGHVATRYAQNGATIAIPKGL